MVQNLLNKNRLRLGMAFLWMISICCLHTTTVHAQDTEKMAKQNAFEQIFGDAVRLDPAMVEKVKMIPPRVSATMWTGTVTASRRRCGLSISNRAIRKQKKPILVKVIDENGNLEMGKEPEKYGDLWIADWHADGLVDAVISYRDFDGDGGDLDVMEWFTYGKKGWRVPFDGLRVLVSTDDGGTITCWITIWIMSIIRFLARTTHILEEMKVLSLIT